MFKTIAIIISVFIGMLITGLVSYFLFFRVDPVWEIETTTDTEIATPTYREQRAIVEEQNEQNSELYNTAMREQNISMCTGISDEEQQIECQDMIRATTAKKSGTIETCDILSSTGTMLLCRDVISADRAIAAIDRSLCAQVTDTDRRGACEESIDEIQLARATQDNAITRELCDTLGDRYQSICLTQIHETRETALYRDAIDKNDTRLCDQIVAIELRSTCLDTIRLKSAVTTESTDLCSTIADRDKQLYCEAQVSKATDIATYKSATRGTDPTACSPIVTENLRNKCNDTIIIASVKRDNNTTLCDGLTATGMISACRAIGQ